MLLISLTSCKTYGDDEFIPSLPPITTTGENTFGCYIDGNLLTPRNGTGYQGASDDGMSWWSDSQERDLTIRDYKSGTGGMLNFHFDDIALHGEGEFTINESLCDYYLSNNNNNISITCSWWDANTQANRWYCSMENSGTVTILKYDPVNTILSGTFSCSMQEKTNPDHIIEITEGRFDLNLYTVNFSSHP